MVDLFVQYFDESKPYDTGLKSLMSLKQGHDESNIDFVQIFRILVHSCRNSLFKKKLYELFMNSL